MQVHTISAYQTSAKDFFTALQSWQVDLVLDIRLHNTTQLDGFTKEKDLAYFVEQIDHATYVHDVEFAPRDQDLHDYLHHTLSWEGYSAAYERDLRERGAIADFFKKYGAYTSIALVGTATKKRRSHSEILAAQIEKAMQSHAA